MARLAKFSDLVIDWDLTPEEAVTMYLEWGNNNWHGNHQPVRSKSDYSTYFVVNTWGEKPKAVLIQRNSDDAEELVELELPEDVAHGFIKEYGKLRGVFAPNSAVRTWLEKELYH